MANELSKRFQRRSLGFAGPEGEAFDLANQPQNALANLITNQSIQAQGMPQNYLQRTGGQMIDLGPSVNRPQFSGSPVDVFGQGRGFMQPDGTIVGMNEAGQKFRVQPEGTAAAQQAAQNAELQRRMMLAKVQQEEAQLNGKGLTPADQLAREKFEWEKSQAKLGGAASKASEDERKAAGWLKQADNAYKNMIAAMEKGQSAEAPGAFESMLPESVAGSIRSAPRQQFVQASSSLSEALLRAATGAGVNESEAKQKIQELTPTYFDKPETRKQKLDAIPMYLESLKARSGRAAPEGYSIPEATKYQNRAEPSGQDSEAIAWANANKNDPRAQQILQLHGM